MKRFFLLMAFALLPVFAVYAADEISAGARVRNVRFDRQGGFMNVRMDFDLGKELLGNNSAYIITPVIRGGASSCRLGSVGVYSRNLYYHYLRNETPMAPVAGAGNRIYRRGELPLNVPYEAFVPYEEWMDGAELVLERKKYGCCDLRADMGILLLARWTAPVPEETLPVRKIFVPEYVYVRPQGESHKSRSVTGQAFLDFRVSSSAIDPAYHGNAEELEKIAATISEVRDNPDCEISRIFLKGYASPEGAYSVNARLARERTESLRKYVSGLYRFAQGVWDIAYEAENWEGLRGYVEESVLDGREKVLGIIDSDLRPDDKERRIRTEHPSLWNTLRADCFPFLRRTDYRVEYTVRSYAKPEEILDVLEKHPENLSLEEFYLAAQAVPSGSPEFNRIFARALSFYPEDPAANINAANIDMQTGDFESAARRLSKAGDSAQAEYARGNLAALRDDFAAAEIHFKRALRQGIQSAENALERLK